MRIFDLDDMATDAILANLSGVLCLHSSIQPPSKVSRIRDLAWGFSFLAGLDFSTGLPNDRMMLPAKFHLALCISKWLELINLRLSGRLMQEADFSNYRAR